jgi:hypothetical protein
MVQKTLISKNKTKQNKNGLEVYLKQPAFPSKNEGEIRFFQTKKN